MLVKSKYFDGMTVETLDGVAGKICGLLLDVNSWVVRYVVVQNRSFINRKRILVSTFDTASINYEDNLIKLNLTLSAIEDEPFLEKSEQIGVQVQKQFFDLTGWPYYDKMYQTGWLTGPFGILWKTKGVEHNKRNTALHLETGNLIDGLKLSGMSIQSSDREFGVVKNLMIDPVTWECKFLEIRKVKWVPSDATAIPVEIVESINWKQRKVVVDVNESKILGAPYYNPRIFSTLSERLFLQYYDVKTKHTDTNIGDLQIKKSIA